MKKALKYLGYTTISIVLLVVFYFVSAFALSRVCVGEENLGDHDVSVYILSNGVHTDVVVPIRNEQMDWSELFKVGHTIGKDTAARFVALGWGDKGFYLETPTWADLTVSTAFKAAFSLNTTAIHATFYADMQESESCRKIDISKEQYGKLVSYMTNTLQKDEFGQAINIVSNANYGTNDTFYEAVGSYSLFYTCNTWANNALKAMGAKASLWTPFDTGIFYHYK